MNTVRIGIVGLGVMGTGHAKYLAAGEVEGAVLAAVSDPREERLAWAREQWGEQVRLFTDTDEMLASGSIDAVLVATPHYDHPNCAMKAFEHDLHVLIEKPAGVYTKHVREMNEAAAKSGKVFGIMFHLRTSPIYMKVKDLIDSGEIGEIRRTNWIVTTWYRPQSYYDSGGWRATWAGEGGGVLINQCPHQLDLWQWTTGLTPKRVRAFCSFGKYRNIEVEDEVTAYVEYENGATGVFITTTAETPGTNRFEIVGDRGKLVVEDNNKLTFWRLRVPEPEFNRTFTGMSGQPENWKVEVPIPQGEARHKNITQNFVNAILSGEPLIAPGEEGLNGVMLSNSMVMSTWTDNWVELPFDDQLYYDLLQERIRQSNSRKNINEYKNS